MDAIFGHAFWPLIDIAYPLASVVVFLLYGKVKGGLRISPLTISIFFTYLAALGLISLDDITAFLHIPITLTKDYWVSIEWFYPVYSSIAFFMFGRVNKFKKAK